MPHIYSYFAHWTDLHRFGPAEHVAGVFVASTLLLFLAWRSNVALNRIGDTRIPDEKFSIRTVAELTVGKLRDFVENTMGHGVGTSFVPFFGALFLYIFINNLLGIVPGFNPPTSVITTNFSIAILIFLLTHYFGIREHGIGYVKHFMGPMLALAWLMLPIELISHLVRPLSLSLRLYGNMTGDHVVLSIFTDLTKIGIPVVFLLVGTFISFVQALVFTMLSMVYIGGALEHEH